MGTQSEPGQGKSLPQLLWLPSRQAADAKFKEKRAAASLPGRHVHEKLDITVFKQKTSYADFYEDAECFTLDEYLSLNNVDPDTFPTEGHKIAFIEEDSPC